MDESIEEKKKNRTSRLQLDVTSKADYLSLSLTGLVVDD
jgi:hypothetical protein